MTRYRLDRIATPTATQVTLARHLRRNATPAERYAWTLLRDRRMLGLKFRRQQVLGRCIVDFCCPARRIVLELDGAPHDHPAQATYDRERQAYLERLGYRMVRVRNADLSVAMLEKLLRPLCVPPPPSGGGGQGERMDAGQARPR